MSSICIKFCHPTPPSVIGFSSDIEGHRIITVQLTVVLWKLCVSLTRCVSVCLYFKVLGLAKLLNGNLLKQVAPSSNFSSLWNTNILIC